MTIYILHNDPKKCAEYLDDKSLDKMIKDIAQVLCNVHCDVTKLSEKEFFETYEPNMPLKGKYPKHEKWSQWTRECKANYLYLVELAETCSRELNYRFEGLTEKQIRIEKILIWAIDNVPDLPKNYILRENNFEAILKCDYIESITPLPLVTPKKYIAQWMKDNDLDIGRISNTKSGWNNGSVQSYRNYFQAKLKKILDKKSYRKGDIRNEYLKDQLFSWTRRQRPDWVF